MADVGNEQTNDAIEFLSDVDVRKLLDFPDLTLEQRTVYTLAIFQCPREGEIAGIDWERVDWERGGWWIAKSWNGSTKNRKTRWQVFIEPAQQALVEWWRHCGEPTKGIAFPSPRRGIRGERKRYAKGHDWGWAETRWNNRKDQLQIRPGVPARAGVTTRIRFHDTRDTCATHLLSGTWGPAWSVKAVSKHLGHASTAITEARYAHLTDRAQREHAESVRFSRLPHAEAIQSPAQSPADSSGRGSQVSETLGSGGRARTYDQSVNSRSETQQIQVVEDPAGDLRAIGPESPESLAERLLQRIAADADVPRELLRSIGATMASDAEQVLARGPHALDRAATWALGVRHRTEAARRLANKGSA